MAALDYTGKLDFFARLKKYLLSVYLANCEIPKL